MEQDGGRNNNFGLLRLIFATLVIVSHSPQLLDGNQSREILRRTFGSTSLGSVAVDGFFIISGYLVTKSFVQSTSTISYLKKRVLRIYPGFLVSFWICVLVIAPLVSTEKVLSSKVLTGQLISSMLLSPPEISGVFPGMPFPMLDGSMWTIAIEFGCYIAALFAGTLGLFSRELRAVTVAFISVLLILGNIFIANPANLIRLVAIFGVGSLCYIYRDKLQFTRRGAVISALALLLLMFSRRWAETSVAIFGAYLVFWMAFNLPVFRLSKLANKVDLSYGIYLYAWPVASIIAWKFRDINPWLLSLLTFVGAGVIAYFSWTFIEKPCLGLVKTKKRPESVLMEV